MKARNYWTFTIIFWLLAGLLMFASALWIEHWHRVVLRFFYFPVLGILIASAMTLLYQAGWFRRLKKPLIMICLLALVAGTLTSAALNPLTYLLVGVEMAGRQFEVLSKGVFYHAMFYLVWALLYFHLEGRPVTGPSPARSKDYIGRISVDERGQLRTIPVEDIEYVAASGDYIEIHLAGKSYLKKETIATLESLLDPEHFSRVHRSTIVNASKIAGVTPRGNSTYALALASGRVVTSSRSYRAAVLRFKTGG